MSFTSHLQYIPSYHTYIVSLHITHNAHTGVHVQLAGQPQGSLQWEPERKPCQVCVKVRTQPCMADIEPLSLGQGERAPVLISLVYQGSNHVNIIVRHLRSRNLRKAFPTWQQHHRKPSLYTTIQYHTTIQLN